MDLHRAGQRPDWETVEPQEHNFWQRLAARTGGVATPGNVLTAGGLLLTLKGLYDIDKGRKTKGISELFVGGMADFFDGKAASATGTKHPKGAELDATADKIGMAAALIVLARSGRLPHEPATLIAGQSILNAGLAIAAKARGSRLDVTAEGKRMMRDQRSAVGTYVVASYAAEQGMQTTAKVLTKTADVLTVSSGMHGWQAAGAYAGAVVKPDASVATAVPPHDGITV